MNHPNFLDVLHEQNAEITERLGRLNKLIRALDTIGMEHLSGKLWSIYEGINSANREILDAYGKELHSEFVDSQHSIGQTIKAFLTPISKETI